MVKILCLAALGLAALSQATKLVYPLPITCS